MYLLMCCAVAVENIGILGRVVIMRDRVSVLAIGNWLGEVLDALVIGVEHHHTTEDRDDGH